MEWSRQKQMRVDELTEPGCEEVADYIHQRYWNYRNSKVKELAVVQPQTNDDAAALATSKFGELMECHDIDQGILQMPQRTFRPGCSHISIGAVKPQPNTSMSVLVPATMPNSFLIQNGKRVEVESIYTSIKGL